MHDPKAIRTTNSRSHPLIQRQQVLPQTVKQAPKPRAQAVLGILQPDRNRRTQMPQFLGRNQSVFGHQATDLVAFRLALLAHLKAHPVYGLNVLLLYRLHRHKPHVRTAHRFADRLRIIGVVLVALHIRLHELWRNQLHRNSLRLEYSRPVVRATTSLHANHAARFNRFQHYLEPVRARQLPAQRHLLIPVDPVYLEDRLCQIYANAHKLHGGPLLSVDWSITLPVWHVDAVRVRRGPSHCYRAQCPMAAGGRYAEPCTTGNYA